MLIDPSKTLQMQLIQRLQNCPHLGFSIAGGMETLDDMFFTAT